jgi:hypothetical protein
LHAAVDHREQLTYQASAIAATIGVTSIAILTTYLRFEWHLEEDGQMPWLELLACLSLVAGGVVSALQSQLNLLVLQEHSCTLQCQPQPQHVL